jgi:hypothetical protein
LTHPGFVAPIVFLFTLPGGAAVAQCQAPGYPLLVRAAADVPLDTVYLNAVARAFAYRWQVPSQRRNDFAGWRRVRHRTLPPEPRWADDWAPAASHRARMRVTVYANGQVRAADPEPASGDRVFDHSLRTIATDPMPGAPALPALPAAAGPDSLVLDVTFGPADTSGIVGIARFAASQGRVVVQPGTLNVEVPRGATRSSALPRGATVKYDVTELGVVPPTSIEVLDSSDRELSDAIRNGLLRARFQPAESNCRAITMTVVQRFGF